VLRTVGLVGVAVVGEGPGAEGSGVRQTVLEFAASEAGSVGVGVLDGVHARVAHAAFKLRAADDAVVAVVGKRAVLMRAERVTAGKPAKKPTQSNTGIAPFAFTRLSTRSR
jgi:hypothetical protein